MVVFGRGLIEDYEVARSREWIVANGLGGYASSTIVGLNTRGYHGLLVASLRPPLARFLLLSKLEEEVVTNGAAYQLSTNKYPGVIYPEGFRYQVEFGFDPFPRFVYQVGSLAVEKSLFMVYGENTTVVTYKLLKAPGSATLKLHPLVNCRGFHERTSEGTLRFEQSPRKKSVSIRESGRGVQLFLASDVATYTAGGLWYRNFVYEEESARGYPDKEDHYNPGFFEASLKGSETVSILASTHEFSSFESTRLKQVEEDKLRYLVSLVDCDDDLVKALATAADSFIVRRGPGGRTIVAGYHWFGDWGRDAMISLPGLALVTKRYGEGKRVLELFLGHLKGGLIPNYFSDSDGSPKYNSVDASLWLFNAVLRYLEYTKDLDFVEANLPKLEEIVDCYVKGTLHNIRVDRDGLVCVGDEGLTWMDAKVGDRCVTPRRGKPVEVNALWYNALRIMEALSGSLGSKDRARKYSSMSQKAEKSFEELFWNEDRGCLYDCVDGDRFDASVRPNQILAVGLPFPLLSADRQVRVVEVVERELLTPYGLRSLSPEDPEYRGVCAGDVRSRDLAYHQGTVWPWLIGPFISAYLKVNDGSGRARSEAEGFIAPLREHLKDAGSGSIPEIFDGDPPHRPRGCISQAWSVAEVLRAYVEEVLRIRPDSQAFWKVGGTPGDNANTEAAV